MTEHRLIMLLTKYCSFINLGFMNPVSPSAEKKRRQRLKMSLEAKEAQREKSKVAMQTRRELETKEQIALAKDKHREKKRLKMRKTRKAETEEEAKLHRESDKLAKRRKREGETEEETNLHNEKVRFVMKRKREAETEEETKWHREKNKLAKTRKCHVIKEHCHSKTEEHKDDMEDVISRSKKEALKFLHRTKDPKNPHKHRAIVCIICDRCIIGAAGNPQANNCTDFSIRKGSVLIVTKSTMKQP